MRLEVAVVRQGDGSFVFDLVDRRCAEELSAIDALFLEEGPDEAADDGDDGEDKASYDDRREPVVLQRPLADLGERALVGGQTDARYRQILV